MITKEDVRLIVLEVLKELVAGTIKNEPQHDSDGDEWNQYVFDGELFVDRVSKMLSSCRKVETIRGEETQ